MFRLSKYSVCEITGFTDIEIKISGLNGESVEKVSFTKEANAKMHINQSKKDCILFRLEFFVSGIKELCEIDEHYQAKESIVKAVSKCGNLCKFLQDKTLNDICEYIVKSKDSLEKILPSKNHIKHERYTSMLNYIILFCLNELKNR